MKSTALAAMALACILQVHAVQAAESASAPQVEASEAEGDEPAKAADDEVEASSAKKTAGKAKKKLATNVADFCFFSGTPPPDVKYTEVRSVSVGKSSYGGVKDVLPSLADRARKVGGDAIINYSGSQRFGFLPWRVVHPVARGVAIKWADEKKPDCAAIGGTILKDIMASDAPPAQ